MESLPLLCSSIMSKKLAENPEHLVLDVKTGKGAFLKEWEGSVSLARAMIAAGEGAGIRTTALLTSMDQPLGRTVGNWLELHETIDVLNGKSEGVEDVLELTCVTAAFMLLSAGKCASLAEGARMARTALADGQAMATFERLVAAQGGDLQMLRAPPAIGEGAVRSVQLLACADGWVSELEPFEVGLTSVSLGAGRQQVEDEVDMLAGIYLHKKVGEAVAKGEPVLTLYAHEAREHTLLPALQRLEAAVVIDTVSQPVNPPLISHVMTSDEGLVPWEGQDLTRIILGHDSEDA